MPDVTFTQSRAPVINIQSTLHTTSDLCKNDPHVVYLVAAIIHVQSLCSQVCVYTYTHIMVGQKIWRTGTALNATCHFGHTCHRLRQMWQLYIFFSWPCICCAVKSGHMLLLLLWNCYQNRMYIIFKTNMIGYIVNLSAHKDNVFLKYCYTRRLNGIMKCVWLRSF